MYTTSTAFLDALQEAGVSYIFANFGSDHPAIIEALANAKARGRSLPRLVTCPNEMVALSAAHGFAQVTGRAQAVVVHVECGTQSLGGAVHNAANGRIPALIFAGASPFTQRGEMFGSRNEYIHWIQDVRDQRGLVRGYVKHDNEIRTGHNVKQIVRRAMQAAHSDPQGPVYLVGAREVMEQPLNEEERESHSIPLSASALAPADAAYVANMLTDAKMPVVVTSYLGRRKAAVPELVALCQRLAVGVIESVPCCMNYPQNDPMYQANQWNEALQNPLLAEADVVLIIDSDVPWIPTINQPSPSARIVHIDVDPLKERMPLWSFPVERSYRADAATALRQINDILQAMPVNPQVDRRRSRLVTAHNERRRLLRAKEPLADPAGVVTPEALTTAVRERLDLDALVVNEGISNYKTIIDHLELSRPGSMLCSGAGSLGYNGGAAIGAKLARPDQFVACLTGDGSYMFSAPSTVHWMARHYETPFLQVIYNNRGWKSPKLSTQALRPNGAAGRRDGIGVEFDPPPDYAGIAAAAGGAFARTIKRAGELHQALDEAFDVVRTERRCAVLDVWLQAL
ncbi:thiamine pyrophosphate-requiring protein [Bradyrhizobium sp. CCBAU 51627]|uniref:thiamine pyrophosphate-requiring protein n=1 Tax=Bradyrhizobium sp. CCBAU 51627 TaxID=1325088 RepID=UPI0023055E2C|nr:thiamine pyrophosphate-requiring protein [Bradyrhizobium sp. CCBAU 51627]MDA9433613.1 acetolactate synthase [Bradyrhizobium sp. CCBAU 51627]